MQCLMPRLVMPIKTCLPFCVTVRGDPESPEQARNRKNEELIIQTIVYILNIGAFKPQEFRFET
jgi:hypothetical protein